MKKNNDTSMNLSDSDVKLTMEGIKDIEIKTHPQTNSIPIFIRTNPNTQADASVGKRAIFPILFFNIANFFVNL